jgi:integrase
MNAAQSFADCAEGWFIEANVSDSTKNQRRSYYNRDIYPAFKDRLLSDITEADVRGLCDQVKARGAPGTAVQILGVIRAVYIFAMFKGYGGGNPARFIANSSIARFSPRNRALEPEEICVLYRLIANPQVKTYYQLAIRLLLLTLARRGELLLARWTEIDFEQGVWTVPPGRAKARMVRRVYLSTQAIDVLIHLKALAGESEYLFPSPLDSYSPMAAACLDVCTKAICRRARTLNLSLRDFAPSDLRSTAEENLKAAGFDLEWIDVAMAREEVLRRHRIGDLELYGEVLRHMMQEWANMLDAWVNGASYVPALVPPTTPSS